MFGLGKRPESQQEPVGLPERVEAVEREIVRLKGNLAEMELMLEDFVAKVTKAAKRAYKREADLAARDLEGADHGGELSPRLARKQALRARLQGRG